MDYNYYSDKTISQFVLKKLCQNDKLLYTYYLSGQSKNSGNGSRASKGPPTMSTIWWSRS